MSAKCGVETKKAENGALPTYILMGPEEKVHIFTFLCQVDSE